MKEFFFNLIILTLSPFLFAFCGINGYSSILTIILHLPLIIIFGINTFQVFKTKHYSIDIKVLILITTVVFCFSLYYYGLVLNGTEGKLLP